MPNAEGPAALPSGPNKTLAGPPAETQLALPSPHSVSTHTTKTSSRFESATTSSCYVFVLG